MPATHDPMGDPVEAALLAAHDLTRPPPMPAPLARLLHRHTAEAVERRFAAAALTMAEAAELLAALADHLPAAALAPARAWALARLEQYGAIGIPPALPRALLRGLAGDAADRGTPGAGTALGRAQARQEFPRSGLGRRPGPGAAAAARPELPALEPAGPLGFPQQPAGDGGDGPLRARGASPAGGAGGAGGGLGRLCPGRRHPRRHHAERPAAAAAGGWRRGLEPPSRPALGGRRPRRAPPRPRGAGPPVRARLRRRRARRCGSASWSRSRRRMRRWRPGCWRRCGGGSRDGRIGLFILHNPAEAEARSSGTGSRPRRSCCRCRGRIPATNGTCRRISTRRRASASSTASPPRCATPSPAGWTEVGWTEASGPEMREGPRRGSRRGPSIVSGVTAPRGSGSHPRSGGDDDPGRGCGTRLRTMRHWITSFRLLTMQGRWDGNRPAASQIST